jgi:hypothetical protein
MLGRHLMDCQVPLFKIPGQPQQLHLTYTVQVKSADGCSDTAKVIIKVLNNAPVKANFSSPEYICRPADTHRLQI